MKRILMASTLALALALAGCDAAGNFDKEKALNITKAAAIAAAPSILESVNNSGFDPLQVSPEMLPIWGLACQMAVSEGGINGIALNVDGKKGCEFILKALAKAPDASSELSPIPVEKPAKG
jgi:hypothetical protein